MACHAGGTAPSFHGIVRRVRRSSLAPFLIAMAAFLAIAGLAAYVLLDTAWGKARLCARLSQAISRQMAGSLQVTEIEEIALPRVKAHGVRLVAPDGKAAIEVEQAEIELDLYTLLLGDFAWKRADISHGTVRVTEDAQGHNNMEETFKSPANDSSKRRERSEGKSDGELDLRTMVTSKMVLLIGGAGLPDLRLVDLHGIMRVQVDSNGDVQLRFDEYRGTFAKGLPNGVLQFRNVKGHVQTGAKRLLHFDGDGKFQGEEVSFRLDIFSEPRTRVEIDAFFPKLSAASISTLGLEAWSKLTPGLDVKVRHGL